MKRLEKPEAGPFIAGFHGPSGEGAPRCQGDQMFGAEHPVTVFNQPSGQDGRTLWFSGLPHRFKVGEPHLQRAWVLWFVGLLALSQSLLEYRERALGVIGLALNRTGFRGGRWINSVSCRPRTCTPEGDTAWTWPNLRRHGPGRA